MINNSMLARFLPTHALGPKLNGLNVFCIAACPSTSASSHLSGLNASGSAPHTAGSRWMVYEGTLRMVPAGKCVAGEWAVAGMVTPPVGAMRGRPMAEVECRRRDSLMTASR